MMTRIRIWRLVAAVLAAGVALNGVETVRAIAVGDFDHVGLAPAMLRMEAVANALSALGWSLVAWTTARGQGRLAAPLSALLAGMLWFDVLTTSSLPLPLPPYFLAWGTAAAALQLLLAFLLERGEQPLPPAGRARWLLAPAALVFAASSLSLLRGDFALTDLAPRTLAMHALANGLEAVGWLAVVLLAGGRHARLARRLGFFLAGMWAWDMLTTLPLELPTLDGAVLWGPASVAILLILTARLAPQTGAEHVR